MEPLKEGEVICSECNGSGGGYSRVIKGFWLNCGKCKGDGKLDWVEMIVGKRRSWRIKPGVYTKEIDLSNRILSFEQDMKEIREAIIKAYGIPREFLISGEK